MANKIHIGIGGWSFAPWRGVFYPADLPQRRELEYASRRLGSIEINGTYYGSQKPESFTKWHDETPDDFIFALKGPRFTTNRRVLAEAGESVARFFNSGVLELKQKLGPINWQFAATKKFDAADFETFLQLLPQRIGAAKLRHALEVRHASFNNPEFLDMARAHGVAVVLAGDSEFPKIDGGARDFVYARIMGSAEPDGYCEQALDGWARQAKTWAKTAEVFLYVISGFKEKNPAAALALIERLK